MSDEEFVMKFTKRLAELAEDQHQCTVKITVTKKENANEKKDA